MKAGAKVNLTSEASKIRTGGRPRHLLKGSIVRLNPMPSGTRNSQVRAPDAKG